MSDKKIMVLTGASDGIGLVAARALAKEYQLVLVGHSREKISRIGRELKVPYYVVDFADLEQVKQLGETLVNTYPEIQVLANNAGAVMGERELTKDVFEKTFQVNHLSPFLLTKILLPSFIKRKGKGHPYIKWFGSSIWEAV